MGRRLIVTLLVAFVLAGMAPAGANEPLPKGRFGIGDSIMLSAEDEFAIVDTPVNAEVSRRFPAALQVIRWRVTHALLPRILIVHLGTNGPVDPTDCDELVATVAPRKVFLVTIKVPGPRQAVNNRILRECDGRHDRVFLIRWAAYSRAHDTWFASDGIHLTAEGQAAYVGFIDGKVDRILAALRASG